MANPLKYFAEMRDPRVERTREHLLEEILLIAIAAILSGANGWNEIEDYARSRAAFHRTTPSTGSSRRWIQRSWKRAS